MDSTHGHDLVISRLLQAPRVAVWRAWADPRLLAGWWCPKPWTTEVLAFDLRPGGAFHTLMRGPGPDAPSHDFPGCFVDVVPGARLVFTSMLCAGWRPAAPGMPMTASVSLADEGSATRYLVTVMHPDAAARERHEAMGFFAGWNTVIDQLEQCAQQLGA